MADADALVEAAVAGRLSTRADASKHQGDFRKIVEGVNQTLDAVLAPGRRGGRGAGAAGPRATCAPG